MGSLLGAAALSLSGKQPAPLRRLTLQDKKPVLDDTAGELGRGRLACGGRACAI